MSPAYTNMQPRWQEQKEFEQRPHLSVSNFPKLAVFKITNFLAWTSQLQNKNCTHSLPAVESTDPAYHLIGVVEDHFWRGSLCPLTREQMFHSFLIQIWDTDEFIFLTPCCVEQIVHQVEKPSGVFIKEKQGTEAFTINKSTPGVTMTVACPLSYCFSLPSPKLWKSCFVCMLFISCKKAERRNILHTWKRHEESWFSYIWSAAASKDFTQDQYLQSLVLYQRRGLHLQYRTLYIFRP